MNSNLIFLIVCIIIQGFHQNQIDNYQQQDDRQKIYVHLVPFSDFSFSYSGYNKSANIIDKPFSEYQEKAYKIIDGVIDALLEKNTSRSYTISEMHYFQQYYYKQNHARKTAIRQLITESKLQITSGIYINSDEVSMHYQDMIQNIYWGHRFLKDEFNYVPRVVFLPGKQIFGYSNTQFWIYKKSCMSAVIIDTYEDEQKMNQRKKQKNMEFIYQYDLANEIIDEKELKQQMQDEGEDALLIENKHEFQNMLVHLNYLNSLNTIQYDKNDYVLVDGEMDPEIYIKLSFYIQWIKQQTLIYKTNHILHQVGSHFSFNDPKIQFKLLDQFMEKVNKASKGIIVGYSSPFQYIEDMTSTLEQGGTDLDVDQKMDFSNKAYNFNIYANQISMRFWFTSLKRNFESMRLYLIMEILKGGHFRKKQFQPLVSEVLTNLNTLSKKFLLYQNAYTMNGWIKLDQFLAIKKQLQQQMQVITKDVIYFMQEYHQNQTLYKQEKLISQKFEMLFMNQSSIFNILNDPLQHKSSCLLTFYNPHHNVQHFNIKLKVPSRHIHVIDEFNEQVERDIICEKKECILLLNLNIPHLQYRSIKLVRATYIQTRQLEIVDIFKQKSNIFKTFMVSSNMNQTISVMNKGEQIKLTQCGIINGKILKNDDCFTHIFGVTYLEQSGKALKPIGKIIELFVYKGDISVQLTIKWDIGIITKLRFSRHYFVNGIEIETTILKNNNMFANKIIYLSIKTDSIFNKNNFYTDLNSLHLVKRKTKVNKVQENFYFIGSKVHIQDESNQELMSVYVDRPQMGGSLKEGQIIFQIKKFFKNAPRSYRIRHILQFSDQRRYTFDEENRYLQRYIENPLIIMYLPSSQERFDYDEKYVEELKYLARFQAKKEQCERERDNQLKGFQIYVYLEQTINQVKLSSAIIRLINYSEQEVKVKKYLVIEEIKKYFDKKVVIKNIKVMNIQGTFQIELCQKFISMNVDKFCRKPNFKKNDGSDDNNDIYITFQKGSVTTFQLNLE